MKVHVVIPDIQTGPGRSTKHLVWASHLIGEYDPDVIIELGDFYDMHSLSSYDKAKRAIEGARISRDIEAGNDAFKILNNNLMPCSRRVSLGGNHDGGPDEPGSRMYRHAEASPVLAGTLPHPKQIFLDNGWEYHPFLKPVTVDGIEYCHYFHPKGTNANVRDANAQLSLRGCSSVAGHKQGLKFHTKPVGGKDRFALQVGSFYTHDEVYAGHQGNQHWRGLVVLHVYAPGQYDVETWSLKRLKKVYG